MTARLDPETLARLREVAREHGLVRLGVVRLDHPGFAPARAALDSFLDEGRAGEMEFLTRSRALRSDPARLLPGARSLLVALSPHRGEPGPVARYAQALDYHTVLHRRMLAVCEALERELDGARTLVCVDTKPVMERAAAALAGLGFLGKNGCLIVPGVGSFVLLGAILCTAEWTGPDADVDFERVRWDACGSCTRCLDACPTSAFDGPGRLDPRRCVAYLTIEHRGPIAPELAARMGERIAGCDVCQEVCPYNAGADRGHRVPEPAFVPLAPGPRPAFDLIELANVRSGRHRALVRRTPLDRIPRRHLRRNAIIALGNRAGVPSPAELRALERAALASEPDLREVATRALRRRLALWPPA